MFNINLADMEWKIGDCLLSVKTNSKYITVGKKYKIVSMLPYSQAIGRFEPKKFSIINDEGKEKIVHMENVGGLWNHFPENS